MLHLSDPRYQYCTRVGKSVCVCGRKWNVAASTAVPSPIVLWRQPLACRHSMSACEPLRQPSTSGLWVLSSRIFPSSSGPAANPLMAPSQPFDLTAQTLRSAVERGRQAAGRACRNEGELLWQSRSMFKIIPRARALSKMKITGAGRPCSRQVWRVGASHGQRSEKALRLRCLDRGCARGHWHIASGIRICHPSHGVDSRRRHACRRQRR